MTYKASYLLLVNRIGLTGMFSETLSSTAFQPQLSDNQ